MAYAQNSYSVVLRFCLCCVSLEGLVSSLCSPTSMLDSLCSPSFFFSPFSALPMMSLLLFFFFFPNSLLLPLCATHHRTPMRLHVFIPFSSSIKTALVIRKIGAALRPLSSLAIKLPLDFFPCVCVSNSDCRCDCCNNNDDDDQSDRSLVFYFYPAFFFFLKEQK